MPEWVHCGDEAAGHQLPLAVVFSIIPIDSVEECSSLMYNLMQIFLLYSFIFKLYLLVMLLQFSLFFPLCPLQAETPLPQAHPPLLMSMVMNVSSLASPFTILYFTSPWLFSNYLFILLNPFTSSPIPISLQSGNHQNALRIHDSVSVLLVYLVCFLDSVVVRHIFFAILLFIVLIFLFLNKSLQHFI